MKIRSLTCFLPSNSFDKNIEAFSRFCQETRTNLTKIGYEIQTSRLATPSFTDFLPEEIPLAVSFASDLENTAALFGFNYISLGPAIPSIPKSYDLVIPILESTEHVFLSAKIAQQDLGINIPAINACANIIMRASKISSDGFANLHFAALSNVSPFCPFFPGSYGDGKDLGCSLAIQCADEVIKAFKSSNKLDEVRKNLLMNLEEHARVIYEIISPTLKKYNISFHGFDFSPAPFPEDWCSLGHAIESLGLGMLGQPGSVAAAAIIADTLDHGSWQRAGFNGLMLPVLEDSILAQRTIDNSLSIKDLLAFSAVCGAGLDTIPLPGDISIAQIKGILLDVAALSLRLSKPLTARLMPVPNKEIGDLTDYDFEFFSNGKIMDVVPASINGLLASGSWISLSPRRKPH